LRAYSDALKNTASSLVPKLPAWCVMSLQMSTTSRPAGYSGVRMEANHATMPTSFRPGSRVTGSSNAVSASFDVQPLPNGFFVAASWRTNSWHTNACSGTVTLSVGRSFANDSHSLSTAFSNSIGQSYTYNVSELAIASAR
jgi:hypothetical protein